MTTPDDLTRYLSAAADRVPRTPGDPARAIATGTRRRRRKRVATALAAVVLVAGAGLGVATLTGDDTPDVSTADDPVTDHPVTDDTVTDDTATDDTATDDTGPATDGGSEAPPATLPPDTGAALAWRQADAPTGFWPSSAVWAGDAFVALGWTTDGPAVFRSAAGTDWTTLAAPSRFDAVGLAAEGPRLVIWGSRWPDDPGDTGIASRPEGAVATSDDGGTTWTVLDPVPAPADVGGDHVMASTSVDHAAIVGDAVVAAVATHYEPDVEAILADAGIAFDPQWGYGSSTSDGADGQTFELSVCTDATCDTETRYSAEELGLDPGEVALLAGGRPDVALHRSVAGGPWEPATPAGLSGYVDALVTADGVVVVSSSGDAGSQGFRSPDGVTWAPITGVGGAFPLVGGGDALYGLTWEGTGVRLQRYDVAADSWSPMELGAVATVHDVAAGPAGLVVSGELQTPVVFDPVTLEKDGYAVTWAPDRFTVTEIATGEVILDYGPDDLDADEPPDNVVEREPGDGETEAWGLTVLHPVTGEPLVTLDEDDLAPLVSIDEGSTADPADSFLGWSPDGVGWGWQTTTEAFGDTAWARYVVGDGVVLAFVESIDDLLTGDGTSEAATGVATATSIAVTDSGSDFATEADSVAEPATESSTRVFVAAVG